MNTTLENPALDTLAGQMTIASLGLLPDEFDPELDGEELDFGTEVETEFVQVEEDFR